MGEEKYWRIKDEKTFYEKALKYIDEQVNYTAMRVDSMNTDPVNKKKIYNNIKKYYNLKPFTDSAGIVKLGLAAVLGDVKAWSEFSLDQEKPLEEIMLRCVINRVFDCSFVCYAFESSNINLPDSFLDDMLYVASYLFKFEDWDDKHVEAVTNCIVGDYTLFNELYDDLGNISVSFKLDPKVINWTYRSKEFRRKYKPIIDKDSRIVKNVTE